MFERLSLWLQGTAIGAFLLGTTAGKLLLTMLLAMMPILELRASIPAGVAMGLPVAAALGISIVGNMIPVPFVILFIRKIFRWMRAHSKRLGAMADRMEARAYQKMSSKDLVRWKEWGLLLFVAIPLPGTGAWTGALVAALMNLRLRKAVPVILVGVVIAGLIMTALTYGVTALL